MNKSDITVWVRTRDEMGHKVFGADEEIVTLRLFAKRIRKGRHIYHKWSSNNFGEDIYDAEEWYHVIIPSVTPYQRQIIKDLGFNIIDTPRKFRNMSNGRKDQLGYKKDKWQKFSMDTLRKRLVS